LEGIMMKGCVSGAILLLAAITSSSAFAQAPYNVRTAVPVAAAGDGVTDDTTAFENVIASIPASGGEVYIPAGTYRLTRTLTITGKNIAFRGEGQGISRLIWYAGENGIAFTSTGPSQHHRLAVRRLSVLRGAGSGGAGIQASWPQLVSPMSMLNGGAVTTTIEDVQIGVDPWPNGAGVHWWFGIQLSNATAAKISQFSIQTGGISGIQIAGYLPPASGGKSVGVEIRDGDITGVVRGIESKDNSEATHINGVTIRDSIWGIIFWFSDAQGSFISDCNITSSNTGILIQDASGIAVTENTIYRQGSDNFTGIAVTDSGGPIGKGYRIMNNAIFAAVRNATRYGITMTGAVRDSVVQNNISQNMFYGIYLDGSTTGNHVWSNINRWFDGAAIANGNPGNILSSNW
jgi:parallel beta-helix repeat protein